MRNKIRRAHKITERILRAYIARRDLIWRRLKKKREMSEKKKKKNVRNSKSPFGLTGTDDFDVAAWRIII